VRLSPTFAMLTLRSAKRAATRVVPMPDVFLCASAYSRMASLACFTASARSRAPSGVSSRQACSFTAGSCSRKYLRTASTAMRLATSPAAWPPIPSHTTKMPSRSSYPKLSSLDARTRPTSVSPATSNRKDMRATVYAEKRHRASDQSAVNRTRNPTGTKMEAIATCSRPGLGNLRLLLTHTRLVQMVSDQVRTQDLERFLRRVRPVKQFQVFGRDRSGVNKRLKIDHAVPIILAVNDDRDALGELFRLRQGQQFEHLVEGAKSSRKNHQRLGHVGEPQLAHEEVVELKIQLRCDVGVGHLLEWEVDVHPDGLAPGLGRAEVGGLHNARPSAGADHETMALLADGLRPLGYKISQPAGIFVVACHLHVGPGSPDALLLFQRRRRRRARLFQHLQRLLCLRPAVKPRRAEENDGVLDAFATEAA